MKLIIVFSICISTLSGVPVEDKSSGIILADKLGDFERTKIIDNEVSSPGLGTSVLYGAPGIKATLYIYNMQITYITDGINSPFLKKYFTMAKSDIKQAEKYGHYKLTSEFATQSTYLNVKNKTFPTFQSNFTYQENNEEESLSSLYMTAYNNYIIKIRISYLKSYEKTAVPIIEEFLRGISNMLIATDTQWKIVEEFAGGKVYINKKSIKRDGKLIEVLVDYSVNPSSEAKNGKLINEMITIEEYDINFNKFRVHKIVFLYEDGTYSNFDTVLEWKPASDGKMEILNYLRKN